MPRRIEDYALIGDTETAALVGRDGSIDWLCLPAFDSGACFAALLGDGSHGRWRIAPREPPLRVTRRYVGDTLVLETLFETGTGAVRLVDFMPPRDDLPDVVRIVEGVSGEVPIEMELVVRFDYGSIVPWVVRRDGSWQAVAGPDALTLRGTAQPVAHGLTSRAELTVRPGERHSFTLVWHPSHRPAPAVPSPDDALAATLRWWQRWVDKGTYRGPYRDEVTRSLVTLKALTFGPTGGIVAAPTTSLPEQLGGVRNWDYRYCWLRDATLTLYSLLIGGYTEEAAAWRSWLLRAVAGDASKLQIMYGRAGERRLPEQVLGWLPGYEGSSPVRIGNGAVDQRQLDVYGEVMDALHVARRLGLETDREAWALERELLDHLASAWREPDEGIWEVRGPRRHFTHSKLMCWVAFDRAVKDAERFGLDGPVARWRELRDEIHAEILARGYDATRGTFVQAYDSPELDASLLLVPLVGFLPASDPRVQRTVQAIQRELVADGFVRRYRTTTDVDGLPAGEGAFLACSFWLADNHVLAGRLDEGRRLFESLLALRNDVGLLSEEYDPDARRLVGNFPQAFSHVGLVNTARNLGEAHGPAEDRTE